MTQKLTVEAGFQKLVDDLVVEAGDAYSTEDGTRAVNAIYRAGVTDGYGRGYARGFSDGKSTLSRLWFVWVACCFGLGGAIAGALAVSYGAV